jgi:hypothetical protein
LSSQASNYSPKGVHPKKNSVFVSKKDQKKNQIYTSMFFDTIFGIAACLCASVLVMSVQCGFSVAIDFKEST